MAKIKTKVFIKFDGFSKIHHATKIQKLSKTMKTIKKCQNDIFRGVPKGQKIIDSHKTGKKRQKALSKMIKNVSKKGQKPIKNQSKMAFLGSKKHTFGYPKMSKSAIFRHDEGQNHQKGQKLTNP